MLTSEIKVDFLDYMGDDLTTVNAARVSFDKESLWEVDESGDKKSYRLPDKDKKLIKYLGEHEHYSPFGHAFASFRVNAPVFVARQLVKHKFLRWNEVSRRYVDQPPTFYMPPKWRKKADNVKQGSSEEEVEHLRLVGWRWQTTSDAVERYVQYASDLYEDMIEGGVCPEQARMVLPQNMMTTWWWSGSLDAFANMCNLRCKPDTQRETREVADLIDGTLKAYFPESWKALRDD